jgi:hypothetical protein
VKLTVPAIRAAGAGPNREAREDAAVGTKELLEAIDALLAESIAEAPIREVDRRRRASMALHPSSGVAKTGGAGRPVPPAAA